MRTSPRRKFTPSTRLLKVARMRELLCRRRRAPALVWFLASDHPRQELEALKHRLKWALQCKAGGATYKSCRLRGGMTRTWEDLVALLKQDIRSKIQHIRILQGNCAAAGFRLPG